MTLACYFVVTLLIGGVIGLLLGFVIESGLVGVIPQVINQRVPPAVDQAIADAGCTTINPTDPIIIRFIKAISKCFVETSGISCPAN